VQNNKQQQNKIETKKIKRKGKVQLRKERKKLNCFAQVVRTVFIKVSFLRLRTNLNFLSLKVIVCSMISLKKLSFSKRFSLRIYVKLKHWLLVSI
jgi:hypothetical protein